MQGVLFDLDGVITDTAKFHFMAWQRLASEQLNINLPMSFEIKLKGVSRIESLQRILRFANYTGVTESQISELANKKNNYYVNAISGLTKSDILPGIQTLLIELQQRNIKCAIASASKNASVILEKLALKCYFDAIVDPEMVQNGKPAPDIFLAAAEALNLTAEQCVGIEDSVAGMQAINAAHAVSVLVGNRNEFTAADIVVESTSELSYAMLSKISR